MAGRPLGKKNFKTEQKIEAAKKAKPRTCLKCNRLFSSQGVGNRICWECKQQNDQLFNVP